MIIWLGSRRVAQNKIAANYRKIVLTNHISKILDRVERKDIIKYMDDNDKWDNMQHGSRKGLSTISQLLQHQDDIIRAIKQGENMDVVYLDFTKAYDKVDRCTLIGKLKAMGVYGHLGQWLVSFLLERTRSVKIGDTISQKEK